MPDTIHIYGDIGESFWEPESEITDSWMLDQLASLDRSDTHTVRINSMGGQTHHGVAIYNLLESHKRKQKALNPNYSLVTMVDGFAYSAASLIMLAGDKRIMNSGSRAMIHNAWSFAMGDYREMIKVADYLQKAKESSVQMYVDITGKAVEEVSKLMDDETYFTAQEAVDFGIATELGNTSHSQKASKDKSSSIRIPYEKQVDMFSDLSRLGKGAYVKTMMLGKKSFENQEKYPIDRLTLQLKIATMENVG